MIVLVRIGLLALGVAAFVAAAIFLLRALQIRSSATAQPYGYGQSAARKSATMEAIKGGFAAFLGLLFLISLAVVGLAGDGDEEPAAVELTETPAGTIVETPAGSPTVTPSVTPSPTAGVTPTSPLPTLTPSPTPSVTPTPSATPLPTATVNSPNGLYLRDVPGGSAEVELLPDGAVLTLLGESSEADGLTWERVRTQQGNEGWVAADFLIYTPGGGAATP